ncbi:MAG TPA: hypothetical protein VFQ43_01325 [Nitrososphaera sp.]|nr:hypothetical protein [Nitrososphaera sp.]
MADYKIEQNGLIIVFLSERATKRTSGTNPKIGARLAFRSPYEILQFVQAGESEGYAFEGKEFLAQAS